MDADKESISFGRYLQAIRLEKKISLEQISQQTRIGLRSLLLIEEENHEQLPAEVYVKGFLRSYAKAIGADGDEVIRRYKSCQVVVQKSTESESSNIGIAHGIWWKLLISLVLLVVIIGSSLFAVFYFRQAPEADKPPEQKAVVEAQQTVVEEQQAVATQSEQQDPESDAEPVQTVPDRWLLHVTAVEETWLKVIMDEKGATEHYLHSGDQLELEAVSGFNLLIGNAGGIKLTLNDKPVSVPGKSGDVVTLELP